MRRTHSLTFVFFPVCVLAAISCAPGAENSRVAFGASDAVGRWAEQDGGEPDAAVASDSSAEQSASAAQPGAAGRVGGSSVSAGAGGVAGSTKAAAGGAVAAAGSGGAGGRASSEVDAGLVDTPSGAVTGLTFDLTTSAVGGRYQPKNIGAVWIEDQDGAVVKTLKVWAKTRRRYLTGYLGAMAGGTVDVTASATLSRHQAHSLSWDLKDRSGAVVAPGTYRLRMELTDRDSAGRAHTIDFDTTQGPMTLTPADAPSFSALRIELK